ncbi:MAG: hypothetical protein KF764_27110 [Labilithrix sp.]|nr:hypothetical protein [Labilithrix sp.]
MRVVSSVLVVFSLFAGVLALAACDEPGASLQITGARAHRAPDARVVVDVDLVAAEGLGGNIGTYCTRATFAGQVEPVEQCNADLEDGDTKTVRLVSTSDRIFAGAPISIRVRLGNVDVGRGLAAPR